MREQDFSIAHIDEESGRVVLNVPCFDFDSFSLIGQWIAECLSATVIEQQIDADLHTWLLHIHHEPVLMKAEHYTETLWLEVLSQHSKHHILEHVCNVFHPSSQSTL